MIDFRYHLVSIIAVFLALAVGLLVGSAYLSGPAETLLQEQQKAAYSQNNSLRAANELYKSQVGADQAFAQAGSQRLLTGLLPGEKVVLVQAPGVPSQMTAGVITALQQAGAKVTEQVQIQSNFLAGSGVAESSLTDMARTFAAEEGITLPGSPLYSGAAGQQDAAAVIAASLVSKDGVGQPTSISQDVLSGFEQAGFLQLKTPATDASATLAVLLTPGGPLAQSASQGLAAFAAELKSASAGTVLAGGMSPVPATNAVTLVAGAGAVSTVDNADSESGQVIVAQVLRELLTGKPAANYGIAPGTAPSPAPTPSASSATTSARPSVSPSASTSNGTGR